MHFSVEIRTIDKNRICVKNHFEAFVSVESKVWKYDLLSLYSKMRCKKKKNRSKQWPKSEWTNLEYERIFGCVNSVKAGKEIMRTLQTQCKCWIVSLKWMNVLLQLILLFYSNRLCVLTSHILPCRQIERILFFLCVLIFCILSRFVSISGQPLNHIASQCLL